MNFNSDENPRLTQRSFDEYHLYTLKGRTTLQDRETKQVEMVSAKGIKSRRIYIYNGAFIDPDRYSRRNRHTIQNDQDYGTRSNPKVWVMREIENVADNSLGIALPRGKIRFYRRDGNGSLQFIGEDYIDHTPRNETLRLYTGNAFDLIGERKQTHFKADHSNDWLDESFKIKLRNHKETEAVEIRVVEQLYRWTNWEIRENSNTFLKTDAQTIEFRIPLAPGAEHTLTYTVHYTW